MNNRDNDFPPYMRESVRTGARSMLGRTIKRVIMRVRKENIPKCQLLLEFTDGMSFEFYCSEVIVPTKGVCDNSIMEPSDGVDLFDWRKE